MPCGTPYSRKYPHENPHVNPSLVGPAERVWTQLSRAVVMYDARALAKQITCLKQELRGRAAQAAPAGVGGA